IQQMLSSNIQLSGKTSDIKVMAVDGRVKLQGTVKNKEDIERIIKQVENVAGVDHVDNQLKVGE
ncbi:MAG: BON domain-containing protein, partial [Candidatus Omnitrophica bacterium]|nr:BON domain-containing protein [Candidatus Omnitrophota bacterium]